MQYKNSVYGIVKSYPRHHLKAVIIGVNFDDVNSLNFVDFLIKGNFPFHFKCCYKEHFLFFYRYGSVSETK